MAGLRGRVLGIGAALVTLNLGAWILAFCAFGSRPLLLGTALLAYTFGLRHAVDADHISAIDNVTRKLLQERRRPLAVGLFFSLGHSTIVVLLSVLITVATTAVRTKLPQLQDLGGLIGTSVSAAFLFVLAAVNFTVFIGVVRTFREVTCGGSYSERSLNELLNARSLSGRFFAPLFGLVSQSWHMYPVGVLFGLGFDTATEVGLLGIAAVEASKGLPVLDILIFPLLFTAGMSLIDTMDGMLMLGAYGWAFVKPIRKLYYNMTITLISVLVALAVGGIEVAALLGGRLNFTGAFWAQTAALSNNFGTLGFAIIGIFVASWGISTLIYKWRRYDDIEIVGRANPSE
ncbi:MAG TPA: HoxN/HupN/NixA family nickel/cobalt transporter [Candidatus Acidoferrales bacterium]|nr:HoxN/HupN/NixA family nickel/cobalt transporter [Candidatus Acidoferrales bacterium]